MHLKNSYSTTLRAIKIQIQFHLKNSSNRGIHELKSEPSQFDELFSNYNFTWKIRQIIFVGHFENTAFQSLIEQSIFYRKVCIFALFSISKKVGGSNCIPRKTEQTSHSSEAGKPDPLWCSKIASFQLLCVCFVKVWLLYRSSSISSVIVLVVQPNFVHAMDERKEASLAFKWRDWMTGIWGSFFIPYIL